MALGCVRLNSLGLWPLFLQYSSHVLHVQPTSSWCYRLAPLQSSYILCLRNSSNLPTFFSWDIFPICSQNNETCATVQLLKSLNNKSRQVSVLLRSSTGRNKSSRHWEDLLFEFVFGIIFLAYHAPSISVHWSSTLSRPFRVLTPAHISRALTSLFIIGYSLLGSWRPSFSSVQLSSAWLCCGQLRGELDPMYHREGEIIFAAFEKEWLIW